MTDSALQQGYLTPLRVENVDAKNWRFFERFGWRGSKDDELWIEVGETTDFATVPWWTQAILPRTGTWTKAASIHDKMCNLLNAYYEALLQHEEELADWLLDGADEDEKPVAPEPPVFSSIDTDAIFRKNAREEGTDPIRSELLWFGVRSGALANAARREEWLSTSPRYAVDLVAILTVVVTAGMLISWVWPW